MPLKQVLLTYALPNFLSGQTDVVFKIYEVVSGAAVSTLTATEIGATGVYFVYWVKHRSHDDYIAIAESPSINWKAFCKIEG